MALGHAHGDLTEVDMDTHHIVPVDRPAGHTEPRDRGSALALVLVATVTFSMVVVSLAGFVLAGLRYGSVVEERAKRLAAADAGLRYGIEKLRNFQDLCTTAAGTGGGFTTIFPPEINGAVAAVTCRRVGSPYSDIQGWGAVVTGAHVPSHQPLFITRGAGGATNNVKTLRGPLFIADPTRLDLDANLVVKDGDLWHTHDGCRSPVHIPEMDSGRLKFEPDFLRGPLCVEQSWNGGLFTAPSRRVPTSQALAPPVAPPDDSIHPGCRVFSPGRYTGAVELGANNYFKAGDYYFENADLVLFNRSLLAGFPGGAGDTPKTDTPECSDAMATDQNESIAAGRRGGATFWLGGSSKIVVDTGGRFEIFRRQQAETFLSVVAVEDGGVNYMASSHSFRISAVIHWLIETKSGNTNDMAIHGLIWAPYSKISLGNITNSAIGQILGGVVIAQLDTQASNSASAFAIGVESNPVEARLLLESTATKNGLSTSIRAVVQFRPDSRELAVNSWRVS
jgi:hypothetical protein